MQGVIQIPWTVAATLLVAIFAMMFGFGKLLLSQFEKRMDERAIAQNALRAEQIKSLADSVTFESGRISTLYERVTAFTTQLPLEYVRREDWIRFSATIDSKLDRLADLFIKAIGAKNERS